MKLALPLGCVTGDTILVCSLFQVGMKDDLVRTPLACSFREAMKSAVLLLVSRLRVPNKLNWVDCCVVTNQVVTSSHVHGSEVVTVDLDHEAGVHLVPPVPQEKKSVWTILRVRSHPSLSLSLSRPLARASQCRFSASVLVLLRRSIAVFSVTDHFPPRDLEIWRSIAGDRDREKRSLCL